MAHERTVAGIRLVPYPDDAPGLWDTWVGMGGEGYRPEGSGLDLPAGRALPAWLELKPKLTLTVTVTGGSFEQVTWGGARP